MGNRWRRYGLAIAAVAAAVLLRWVLHGVLGEDFAFITFYPAVALVAMVWGGRAGVLATILSALAVAFWLHPGDSGSRVAAEALGVCLFIGAGLLISAMAAMLGRARVGQAVRESESKPANAFAASPDAMVLSRAEDGLIREVNESGARLFGLERRQIIGRRSTELGILDPADRGKAMAALKQGGRLRDYELPIRRASGEVRSTLCSVEPIELGGELLLLSIVRDITEQKQAAQDQELATEVLRVLNRGEGDLHELIRTVLRLVKERAGFDAVGLRLRDGNDCPYFQQDGFSDEFLREENFLCAKGIDGSILHDAAGEPVLECTCGLVLSGRTDPAMPCFTRGGSFWTNRSPELLTLAPELDPRQKPRNRCIYAGYQSVALIPVRSGEQIVGLLQLNDRRPDRFTLGRIGLFERLAGSLGMALQRRQAEDELRRSEEQFRVFFNNSAIGTAEVSPEGKFLAVNDRYCQITGYSREELLALHPLQLSHPDDRAHDAEGCMRHLLGELPAYDTEKRYLRKDGQVIWVRLTCAMSYDAEGKPLRSFGIVQDITERKEAEEALRESEQRLSRAQAIAHLGSWELDLARNRLTWSDEVYRIFGLAPQEFAATYEAFLQHVHPDDRAAVDAAYSGSLRENRDSYEIEHRVVRKSGEVRFVHEKCQHVRDHAGRLIASLGMVLDITDRKQAEEALRRSDERLKQAVRVTDLGIFEHDHLSDAIYYSPTLREVFGWGPEEPVTLPAILDRVLPEEREDLANRIRRAHDPAGDGLYAVDHRIVRPDGGIRWVSVRSRTFFEGEGAARRALRTIGAMLDITERKQAEEDVLRAKAAAEAASQAKDHFMAVLSHELRTPLAPVLATVSMLREDARFDADTQESLEVIHRNVELEARLIDDLLDVTRIARGKVTLDRRPVDVCTILRRAAEVCMPDIEARRLHFGIEAPETSCMVHADAARLQQVFWNLLKNATKFTPEGGCVGTRCWCDGDGQVIVQVSDSGIGIEPEAMSRLFNAFEQGEQSTTRQFGGLGLGLTISKAMVELHGGSIEASSAGRDKGATFTVRLPLMVSSATAPPTADDGAPGRPQKPTTSQRTRPLRILLVEDHGDTARIMRRLLRTSGHEVQTAADVATALKLAAEQAFDLLLSDLGLPDGSGLDLMRTLRAHGSTIPAVALTGYGQEQDIAQSREAGFAAHLVKPISPAQLADVIANLFGGSPTPLAQDRHAMAAHPPDAHVSQQ